MRRWTVRILVGSLVGIVLVAIGVQGVLWSQLPKNVILPQIEKQLGLQITAGRMTTGWLGYTTLDDVSVSLPLAQKAFLNVHELKLKENSLFALALTQALGLNYIEIDQPNVVVLQNASGTWNLQEVAELLGKIGGGKEATDKSSGGSGGGGGGSDGVPKLPNIRLLDGTVTVVDNQHHTTKLSPLSVNGYAGSALVWNYDVAIGQSFALAGKVAPGGNWRHELKLRAHHLEALTGSFAVPTYDADLAATWDGALNGNKVAGTLRIDHATAAATPLGDLHAGGAVDLQADGPVVTVSPRTLDLLTTHSPVPEVKLGGGTITYDAGGLHVNGLQVSALGGAALVHGGFDPASFSGSLDTRWSGLALTSGISHSGSLLASLKMPLSGHPEIKLELNSHGKLSAGQWDAQLDLVGEGESWKSIDWVLTAPQLSYTGSQSVHFTGLVGHVAQRYPSVELTSLSLPARPHLSSAGKIDLHSGDWYFWMNTGGTPSIDGEPVPVDFFLNTWGTRALYTLKEMDLQIADTNLWAAGSYERAKPRPVNLDVALVQSPALAADSPIQGHVRGQAHLAGRLFDENQNLDCDVKLTGDLRSRDLVVMNHTVGDTAIHLEGSVKHQDDWRVYSTEFNLFQGRWKLLAHGPLSDGLAELTVDMDDVPVEELGKLADVPGLSGNLQHGQLTLDVPRSPALTTLQLTNSAVQLRGLRYGTTLAVDRADLIPKLSNGVVTLQLGASSDLGGYAGATATYNLATPKQATADYQLTHWVYPLGGSGATRATVVASVPPSQVAVTLSPFSLSTSVKFISDLKLGPAPFAHSEANLQVAWPVVTLSSLNGRVLNGTFDGQTTLDLSDPLSASGQLHWYNVDAGAITTLLPELSDQLQGLAGVYSGTVTIAPAREPRPKGPVRVDVNVSADGAHYRTVQIGSRRLIAVHAVAYANTDRAVLDTCDVDVAGGMVHVRGRLDRGFKSGDLLLGFDDLQLDQLAHVAPKLEDQPMPGRLTGSVHVIASGFDVAHMDARVKAGVVAADLGNFGPIAAVYGLLHPGGADHTPQGTGNVAVSFEQGQMRVTDFHYFNRGIDAHGVFTLPDVLDFPNCPVNGQVAGTVDPLANTRLPFLSDFNSIFAALQSNLTSITVTGTAAAPKYTPSSLADLGDSLKELLVGSARSNDSGD